MLAKQTKSPNSLFQNKTLKSKVTSQTKHAEKFENQVMYGFFIYEPKWRRPKKAWNQQ